jgi:hypothetical protein
MTWTRVREEQSVAHPKLGLQQGAGAEATMNHMKGKASFKDKLPPFQTKRKTGFESTGRFYTISITESGPGVLGASGTEGLRADEDSQEGDSMRVESSSRGVGGRLGEVGS